MAYRTITPQDASAQLDAGTGTVYLDVRSQREFAGGHPKGAINIPVAEPDDSGQMNPNPDFLAVAEATLAKETPLVVGCMSGKRSDLACRILEQAGYGNLANVHGGFGGARDVVGRMIQPGWSQLGLPVSEDAGAGASYASLRKKALG